MIDELDCVVLTTDIPEHGLAAGDIGTVVIVHEAGRASRWNSWPSTAKPWRWPACRPPRSGPSRIAKSRTPVRSPRSQIGYAMRTFSGA